MKIGSAVKTLRGWAKMKIGSTGVRPFKDAKRHFTEIFGKIDDDQPCMFEITVWLPPKKPTTSKPDGG